MLNSSKFLHLSFQEKSNTVKVDSAHEQPGGHIAHPLDSKNGKGQVEKELVIWVVQECNGVIMVKVYSASKQPGGHKEPKPLERKIGRLTLQNKGEHGGNQKY